MKKLYSNKKNGVPIKSEAVNQNLVQFDQQHVLLYTSRLSDPVASTPVRTIEENPEENPNRSSHFMAIHFSLHWFWFSGKWTRKGHFKKRMFKVNGYYIASICFRPFIFENSHFFYRKRSIYGWGGIIAPPP